MWLLRNSFQSHKTSWGCRVGDCPKMAKLGGHGPSTVRRSMWEAVGGRAMSPPWQASVIGPWLGVGTVHRYSRVAGRQDALGVTDSGVCWQCGGMRLYLRKAMLLHISR